MTPHPAGRSRGQDRLAHCARGKSQLFLLGCAGECEEGRSLGNPEQGGRAAGAVLPHRQHALRCGRGCGETLVRAISPPVLTMLLGRGRGGGLKGPAGVRNRCGGPQVWGGGKESTEWGKCGISKSCLVSGQKMGERQRRVARETPCQSQRLLLKPSRELIQVFPWS